MDTKIKNIVFDVGNVLIDFCWKKPCMDLCFDERIMEAFRVHMIESPHWNDMDEGILSLEDAIQIFIGKMPQYESQLRAFWKRSAEFVEEYDYAADLIDTLKERGYKVYLLSNYPLEMYELHWPTFSFFSKVDGYVVSAVEKIRKPDLAIYQLLCERFSLKPEECVFFDDRQENVDAAISCGMESVLFSGYETVSDYLVGRGLPAL